jgi:hypothetical protein
MMVIGVLAAVLSEETFGKDLDYLENHPVPVPA